MQPANLLARLVAKARTKRDKAGTNKGRAALRLNDLARPSRRSRRGLVALRTGHAGQGAVGKRAQGRLRTRVGLQPPKWCGAASADACLRTALAQIGRPTGRPTQRWPERRRLPGWQSARPAQHCGESHMPQAKQAKPHRGGQRIGRPSTRQVPTPWAGSRGSTPQRACVGPLLPLAAPCRGCAPASAAAPITEPNPSVGTLCALTVSSTKPGTSRVGCMAKAP